MPGKNDKKDSPQTTILKKLGKLSKRYADLLANEKTGYHSSLKEGIVTASFFGIEDEIAAPFSAAHCVFQRLEEGGLKPVTTYNAHERVISVSFAAVRSTKAIAVLDRAIEKVKAQSRASKIKVRAIQEDALIGGAALLKDLSPLREIIIREHIHRVSDYLIRQLGNTLDGFSHPRAEIDVQDDHFSISIRTEREWTFKELGRLGELERKLEKRFGEAATDVSSFTDTRLLTSGAALESAPCIGISVIGPSLPRLAARVATMHKKGRG